MNDTTIELAHTQAAAIYDLIDGVTGHLKRYPGVGSDGLLKIINAQRECFHEQDVIALRGIDPKTWEAKDAKGPITIRLAMPEHALVSLAIEGGSLIPASTMPYRMIEVLDELRSLQG